MGKARRMAKKAKQAVDEKAKTEEEARKQREAEEAAAKLAAEQKAKADAIAKALEDPCEPGWHILLVDKVKVREAESTDSPLLPKTLKKGLRVCVDEGSEEEIARGVF